MASSPKREMLRNKYANKKHYKSIVLPLTILDGEKAEIRSLSIKEATLLNSSFMQEGESKQDEMLANMAVNCCFVPDTDEKIWDKADVATLVSVDIEELQEIADAVGKLSGTTPESQDEIQKKS